MLSDFTFSARAGVSTVATPANDTDFSGLPGGVAPTSGMYFAPRDQNSIWQIDANDSEWKIIDKYAL